VLALRALHGRVPLFACELRIAPAAGIVNRCGDSFLEVSQDPADLRLEAFDVPSCDRPEDLQVDPEVLDSMPLMKLSISRMESMISRT
jgi:hypothetical protein